MASVTRIEWCDRVWNVAVGCSLASTGCQNCYAMKFAHRGLSDRHRGLTVLGQHGPRWTGEVRPVPEVLSAPLKWRKPQVVFVNSMSDIFHEKVPFEYISAVFGVMAATPQHTYIVLTKRDPRKWFDWIESRPPDYGGERPLNAIWEALCSVEGATFPESWDNECGPNVGDSWPLTNVVLGVSCENQRFTDKRMPWLLQTPAACRIVSLEPLLGPIDISRFLSFGALCECDPSRRPVERCNSQNMPDNRRMLRCNLALTKLSGVIVGGESGPGARPCNVEWIRDIVQQCKSAGTSCFVKQLGANPVFESSWSDADPVFAPEDGTGDLVPIKLNDRKGANPSEWPEDLRIRELPWITP